MVISTLSEDIATGKPLFKNQVKTAYEIFCRFYHRSLFNSPQTSLYLRGSGGFGGPNSSEKVIEPARIPAESSPDAISEYQVDICSNFDANVKMCLNMYCPIRGSEEAYP